MKKILVVLLVLCLLLAGCNSAAGNAAVEENPQQESVEQTAVTVAPTAAEEEQETTVSTEEAVIIYPLPNTIMDDMNDAILSVSLEEGSVYVDDAGVLQMDVKIYGYDVYDMVDISMMKEGDVLVTNSGEVKLVSVVRNGNGSISINGGLLEGGLDLVSTDHGIFYESGLDDANNWYQVGEATIRVSTDFEYHDNSDLEKGEIVYYPGSFLNGEVTDYNFTPNNTTIRVENGQIIEMIREFTP